MPRIRTMRVSAMLVMDIAGIIMLSVRMPRHVVASGDCACAGLVVMMMSVVAMIAPMISVIVVTRCRVRQRRHKQWLGSVVR